MLGELCMFYTTILQKVNPFKLKKSYKFTRKNPNVGTRRVHIYDSYVGLNYAGAKNNFFEEIFISLYVHLSAANTYMLSSGKCRRKPEQNITRICIKKLNASSDNL